jgi:chitin synthase
VSPSPASAASAAAAGGRPDTRGQGQGLHHHGKIEIVTPIKLVFALKEHNGGKLNSHLWAFRGLARQIAPKYMVLVDVGTKPNPSAIHSRDQCMERDAHIGGCCCELAVDHPFQFVLNPVVAAQHFEYKSSNLTDKAMESMFGFITVLPGAFSAYRLCSIEGKPLDAYFKSLRIHNLGAFQGNMYLAEDRILVFELLAKRGCGWTMHYVKVTALSTSLSNGSI